MKNTLGDLNNHLFAQLERLNDEDITQEQLEKEIMRAKSVSEVSMQIINNANLILRAEKFKDEKLDPNTKVPKMLEGQSD